MDRPLVKIVLSRTFSRSIIYNCICHTCDCSSWDSRLSPSNQSHFVVVMFNFDASICSAD